MRRLVLLSLAFGLSLQAQEFKHGTGYVGFGFSTPISEFGTRHDVGWNALVGGGWRFNRLVGLNVEYSFADLGYKFTGNPILQATALSGTTQLHGFTLNPRITTPNVGKVGTYVTAGWGIYVRHFELTRPAVGSTVVCDPYWYYCTTALVSVDVAVAQRDTWKQGWNIGAGVEFGGRFKFFADGRFVWVATPNVRTQSVPVNFGVRF
jgi:opacity protein-like surface antigen